MEIIMKRTIFATIAMAVAFAAAAPAFAGGFRLINKETNYIINSPGSDRAGTVNFFNLPEGPYQIAIDATKLTKPVIVKVQAGHGAPVTSAPILPTERRSAEGVYVVIATPAGAPLTFVVPPGSGAPRGAKPKAVSGPAPRDANPLSTIAVTIIGDLGPMPPKT
jgi:hypothetical protein